MRNADGTVITSPQGEPYYETAPNTYEDSNWLTKREERDVEVVARSDGSYTAKLGSRTNDVSENGIQMVTGSIEATTRLVSECAAAYVKIAGGGVATDATTAVVSKIIQAFTSGGGNTEKASVTMTEKGVTVSDGTICTTCSPDGTCTTGAGFGTLSRSSSISQTTAPQSPSRIFDSMRSFMNEFLSSLPTHLQIPCQCPTKPQIPIKTQAAGRPAAHFLITMSNSIMCGFRSRLTSP